MKYIKYIYIKKCFCVDILLQKKTYKMLFKSNEPNCVGVFIFLFLGLHNKFTGLYSILIKYKEAKGVSLVSLLAVDELEVVLLSSSCCNQASCC